MRRWPGVLRGRHRDWTSEPIPRLVTPAMLIATVCGCGDGASTGFVASDEAKHQEILMQTAMRNKTVESYHSNRSEQRNLHGQPISQSKSNQQQQQPQHPQLQPHQQQHQQQDVFRTRDNNSNNDPVAHILSNQSSTSNRRRRTTNNEPPDINHVNSVSTTATSNAGRLVFTNNSEGGSVASSFDHPVKRSRSARSELSGSDVAELRQPDSSVPSEGSARSKTSPGRLSPIEPAVVPVVQQQPQPIVPPKHFRTPTPVQEDRSYQEEEEDAPIHRRPLNLSNLGPRQPSPPPSEGGQSMSIGESHTTIPISNHSPVSVSQKEREMRSRKLDQLEEKAQRIQERHHYQNIREEDEEEVEVNNSKERGKAKSKKKERRDKEKRERKEKRKKEKELNRKLAQQEQEEQERLQQQLQQEEQERLQQEEKERLQQQQQQELPKQPDTPSRTTRHRAIHKAPSNHSLDYSLDDNSYATFGGENSVQGNQSLLSYVTRSTVATQNRRGDDDSLVHSLTSAEEVVPSDESLFSIGWAKALDENSGSYYYFTLDRSKTVWENPLLSEGSVSGTTRTFSSEE